MWEMTIYYEDGLEARYLLEDEARVRMVDILMKEPLPYFVSIMCKDQMFVMIRLVKVLEIRIVPAKEENTERPTGEISQ